MIKNFNENPKKVQEVIDFVKESGGMDYARQKMEEYYQGALEILDTFPESDYRKSLKDLVEYTIVRKK